MAKYNLYAGLGGEIAEDYCEQNGIEFDELSNEDWEEIESMYMEEVEGWISYMVTTIEEDPEHDRYYEW